MAEAGILHEDDRVELIDGEIVEMSPIGGLHVNCVGRLTRILSLFVGERYLVNVQSPVRLDERREPQPDIALVHDRKYGRSLPGPEDVLLLAEVAHTSLAYDRDVKLPLYAGAGIPEVWIVDLPKGIVERYTDPSGDDYRRMERARRGETIESVALSGLSVRVDDVLGQT
jgi:Uma2 family endonuclease